MELPYGGRELGRIHRRANRAKHEAYWLGFLSGVLASEKVEALEMPALRAESQRFLDDFHDDDAAELLRDLDTDFVDHHREVYDVLSCIIDMRSRAFDAENEKNRVNRFLGFCAGIACDNRITPKEARRLLDAIGDVAELADDARVLRLQAVTRAALADGVITGEESADIAEWICRLVGDSCADTGLATFGNTPVLDGLMDDETFVTVDGRRFVVTGAFMVAPRKVIKSALTRSGGIVSESVSRKTDYLVVGGEASRDWKYSHEGTKLVRARELRAQGGRPHLIGERLLCRMLGGLL